MAEQHSAAAVPLLGSERNQATASTQHDSHDQREHHDGGYDIDDDDNFEDAEASTWRHACARALASRRKHFLVMGIVALDVTTLLANIFIQLIACEMHQADEPWVESVTTTLEVVGLVFSTAFMLELAACIFAFGWRYIFLSLEFTRLQHSSVFAHSTN